MKIPKDREIAFLVFETTLGDKTVTCCMSGGELHEGKPRFTLIGLGAVEALLKVPAYATMPLIFQELKMGPTPLKEKICEAIRRAPEGARICFLGDFQGELDGFASTEFNLTGEPLVVEL